MDLSVYMPFSIRKISFYAGKDSILNLLEIEPSSITILVGPNNSGKSQALRDIEASCINKVNHQFKVVKEVELHGYPKSFDDTKGLIRP